VGRGGAADTSPTNIIYMDPTLRKIQSYIVQGTHPSNKIDLSGSLDCLTVRAGTTVNLRDMFCRNG
jgi:hypothetical protein